jgi:hypothetical protein
VTPADPGSRPGRVWAEIVGGDTPGRGHEPALSWWLPEGSSVQHAYRVGGQREDHRLPDPGVHDPAIDDTADGDASWHRAVTRDVDVALVRSVAPPVRRTGEIRPVAVRPVRDGKVGHHDGLGRVRGGRGRGRPAPGPGRGAARPLAA